MMEFKLGKYSYDIHVEETPILIEYDGKKWHDTQYAADLDLRKSKLAAEHGYELIRITEADWRDHPAETQTHILKVLSQYAAPTTG
jgi:very-short-patch-repair endonuclease